MHTTLNVINSPIKSPILKYKSNLKVTSPNNGSQKNIHTTPISNNKIIKPTMGTVKAINFVY